MRYIYLLALIIVSACTQNNYPSIDRPSTGVPNGQVDRDIIDYIDQRLEEEYYWLDEVVEKGGSFDRGVAWDKYLSTTLSRLKSNSDDGYINSKGQRVFYSYIREYQPSTRATTNGFGISLHYTVLVINKENTYLGFIVDHVYPDSPAAQAGIERGDMITKVNNGYITQSNYTSYFPAIENSTVQSIKLTITRQTTKESFAVELNKGIYDENPIAHSEVITIDGYDKKIGYIVYTSFESEYDEELFATLQELAAEGAEEVILDLRINGGGSVNSAIKLCSALMPQSMEGDCLCSLVRNPKNKSDEHITILDLKDTGSIFSLDRLTVICSGYSASASELVIIGLRGLDVPVTLIGSTTEGKNYGMDVTRRKIGDKNLEFAPITFLCINAKGFSEWGDGITPDIDLTAEGNSIGVHDANYPMPRTKWGDMSYDIALAAAISHITGKQITQKATRSEAQFDNYESLCLDRPTTGIRLLREE